MDNKKYKRKMTEKYEVYKPVYIHFQVTMKRQSWLEWRNFEERKEKTRIIIGLAMNFAYFVYSHRIGTRHNRTFSWRKVNELITHDSRKKRVKLALTIPLLQIKE